jgi:hypothetical protein
MNAIRVETTIQTDGELHLTQLPCRRGDKVEAIVLVLEAGDAAKALLESNEADKAREEALKRFLARASASRFRSTGPYPSRDELHERR